jgi:hypothetical protein
VFVVNLAVLHRPSVEGNSAKRVHGFEREAASLDCLLRPALLAVERYSLQKQCHPSMYLCDARMHAYASK